MILLFVAASLAAAAPAPTAACPAGETTQALVCQALSAQQRGDTAAAATAFENAASRLPDKDLQVPSLLTAAANMWLTGDQPGKAAFDLDKALALPSLQAEQRGEALLDRARAAEAQGDLKTARNKWNQAGETISKDPFYWYFSAALAIREGDRGQAETSINKALALAPNDPTVLFEAGHVADFLGDRDKARSYWMRAAGGNDPQVRQQAAKAIELLGVTPVVKTDTTSPK